MSVAKILFRLGDRYFTDADPGAAEALGRLNERERSVVQADDAGDSNLAPRAKELGVTRERARQVRDQAEKKLRAMLATSPPPRPFVWTSEPPTTPGWYWFRYEGQRAKVEYVSREDVDKSLCVGVPNCPIPEPVEPEGGE